jgi:hypothetical protein
MYTIKKRDRVFFLEHTNILNMLLTPHLGNDISRETNEINATKPSQVTDVIMWSEVIATMQAKSGPGSHCCLNVF